MKTYCPEYQAVTDMNFMGTNCTVVDLSQSYAMDDPTFNGHQRTLIWRHLSHKETQQMGLTKPPYSYQVTGFTLCDHSGTHVDSINHVVDRPDARPIDLLPTQWFMCPGVWFDFSWKEPNAYITKDDILKAIDKTGIMIKPQSVVLYHTGWYKKYRVDRFAYIKDYPGVERTAMEYLADLGVVSVGADAPSIDSYNEVKYVREQPAHIVCREREILNIENLANVDLIPSHEFWFVGLPLKIVGGTGSPIRSMAIVPN